VREQMAAQAAQLQFATHAALLATQTNAAGAARTSTRTTELPSGSERCPACGAQNPPGSRFCAACGSAVAPTFGGV
jgi:zinc ribbon protein